MQRHAAVNSFTSMRVIGGVCGEESSNPVECVVLRWVRLELMAYAASGRYIGPCAVLHWLYHVYHCGIAVDIISCHA